MWHRGPSSSAGALVVECEAVLAGSYAEHLRQRHCPAPPWAWMNLLAHGAVEDLRRASALIGGSGRAQQWMAARAYLAGEVLGLVDQGLCPLDELQREVLIPLELRLADGPLVTRPLPGETVAAVLAELDAQRRTRRHRQHCD